MNRLIIYFKSKYTTDNRFVYVTYPIAHYLLKGDICNSCRYGRCNRGGRGDMSPPPATLKYRGTSYVLVPPPHFYHNIYFDWLVSLHTIVAAPLAVGKYYYCTSPPHSYICNHSHWVMYS